MLISVIFFKSRISLGKCWIIKMNAFVFHDSKTFLKGPCGKAGSRTADIQTCSMSTTVGFSIAGVHVVLFSWVLGWEVGKSGELGQLLEHCPVAKLFLLFFYHKVCFRQHTNCSPSGEPYTLK